MQLQSRIVMVPMGTGQVTNGGHFGSVLMNPLTTHETREYSYHVADRYLGTGLPAL